MKGAVDFEDFPKILCLGVPEIFSIEKKMSPLCPYIPAF
jgi:hypothetical protein